MRVVLKRSVLGDCLFGNLRETESSLESSESRGGQFSCDGSGCKNREKFATSHLP